MPFYAAEFDADTRHLSAAETGAYMRLICHYWLTGGLPTEEERLARIAGMGLQQWQCICSAVEKLFQPNWTHKRIDFERSKAARISLKRSESAHKSWGDKAFRAHANASRVHKQKQSKHTDNYNHNKREISTSLATEPPESLGALSEELLTKIGLRGGGK